MVGKPGPQPLVGIHVDDLPWDSCVPTDRGDRRLGFTTKVTTGASQNHDP